MEASAAQAFYVRPTQRNSKSHPVTWDAKLCMLQLRVHGNSCGELYVTK